MKTTKGLWAKLCLVLALAALGGCGGVGTPTSPCGEDEALDTLMSGILNERFKPVHIRELLSDHWDEMSEEREELEAERDTAKEADARAWRIESDAGAAFRRSRGGEDDDAYEELKAAYEEAKAEREKTTKTVLEEAIAALEEFEKETSEMRSKIREDAEELDAEELDLEDLYNVHFLSVFTTAHEEAPVNRSECKAQVKSDLLGDIMVNYVVHFDTRNGRPYVFN